MNESQPRYLQIYKEILHQIHDQTFSPGDFLPTEAELCKKYQTSRPTIARALKLLSDEKLVVRKAGFGTQVLAPRKSALLAGLLIPQLNEIEIFKPISASIAETSGMGGMRVILPSELSFADDLKKRTNSLADQLIEARVRGVFFAPTEHLENPSDFNSGVIERLTDAGIRVVLIDRDIYRWPRQTRNDLVSIDNIEAGYSVASHLLEQGCKRLVFVTRENPAVTVQLRRMGCREALTQHGLQASSLLTVIDPESSPGKAANELFESGADGIICANDVTAGPILRGLIDRGADIPGRVKVSGFDDVEHASLLSVPLTTYQQPCRDIGRVAAELMMHRIKYPDTPIQRVTLQGQLIIRGSTVKQ
ncbi:GntR family transcriptional regulator [Roseibacillus persicicus]|uniref:GntR family transcriptional regulator n=1 Tax=Roseibacillus persicicus TaxID=454148 RepID=UPI00167C1B54|nr:GntR family transcriptional regulator [Roseibacillus persicicus]